MWRSRRWPGGADPDPGATPAGCKRAGRSRWYAHARVHDRGGPSLAKRLLLTFVVAALLSVALAGATMRYLTQQHLPFVIAHDLDEQAHRIAEHLEFDAAGEPVALGASPQVDWIHALDPHDWKFRVVNAGGVAVLSSEPGAGALAPAGAPFDAARTTFDIAEAGATLHAVTTSLSHDGQRYYVQTAVSERLGVVLRTGLPAPLFRNGVGIAAVALVLFAIGMHFTLGHLLWPLRRASIEADRIDPRNLEARLPVDAMPRELRPLMAAFNDALDRLEKGYRTQQEFLAAAAHELKTPLALLRGQVELSELADRATLLEDIDRMARQVHQLLHLAEVSEVGNYKFELVDVGAVAAEAVAFLQRLALRADVRLDLRAGAFAVEREVDRGALFVLVKNLVENAIQHSPRGAVVTIVIDASGLAVCDEGEGIVPEHLDRLFTRFWRGPSRRDSGAGLGLSICQEIALAHDWRIAARNVDGGAEFRVAFD